MDYVLSYSSYLRLRDICKVYWDNQQGSWYEVINS